MINEEKIKQQILPCEKHLLFDDLATFVTCVERRTSRKWNKTDYILADNTGNIIRVIAYIVENDNVVSILGYYSVNNGNIEYSKLDVDISPIEDVKRFIPINE